MARRGKLEGYRDILESISEGPKIASWISDGTHMNFQRCKERLEELRGAGLIAEDGEEYHLTEEGKTALRIFRELEDTMGDLMHAPVTRGSREAEG